MTNSKYVNDMHPVIIYDSDEETQGLTSQKKIQVEYTQINTCGVQEDSMIFSGDANDLNFDEEFSLKYYPSFYRQLGVKIGRGSHGVKTPPFPF